MRRRITEMSGVLRARVCGSELFRPLLRALLTRRVVVTVTGPDARAAQVVVDRRFPRWRWLAWSPIGAWLLRGGE